MYSFTLRYSQNVQQLVSFFTGEQTNENKQRAEQKNGVIAVDDSFELVSFGNLKIKRHILSSKRF